MKTIYAIPNFECNLKCLHCNFYTMHVDYNAKLFLDRLVLFNDQDQVILFGGEPTLHYDRLEAILNTRKIKTISTNLLDISTRTFELLSDKNLNISTSWNYSRFNKLQSEKWLNNLKRLEQYNKQCTILITITYDLMQNINVVLEMLDVFNNIKSIEGVQFELLISNDNTASYYNDADLFLLGISKNWKYQYKNILIEKLTNDWMYDCTLTYTLFPNGQIFNHCPHGKMTYFIELCLFCEYAKNCLPCKMHKYCSMPKITYKTIKKELNNDRL